MTGLEYMRTVRVAAVTNHLLSNDASQIQKGLAVGQELLAAILIGLCCVGWHIKVVGSTKSCTEGVQKVLEGGHDGGGLEGD